MAARLFPLLLLIITRTVTAQQNDSCCYGKTHNIENGDLIASFPSQCMQLICHHGNAEPRYYADPMDCGCCIYNGKIYRNGERIDGACTDLTCSDGKWVTQGYFDDCCEMCDFQDDPHIGTYDGYFYDWHGTCNYSLSQENFGYQEAFGIYGQFKQCNGLASCVDITTFKDNPHTVIQVTEGQGPNVLVNNNPYIVTGIIESLPVGDPSAPVLSWTDGACNFFLGSQGFLLMTCTGQIFIFAYPNLVGQVNGLCGHLNLYQPDDFTDRDGYPHILEYFPNTFPVSWLTSDQTNPGCDVPPTEPPNDPCTMNQAALANLKEVCITLFLHVNWRGKKCSKVIIDIAIQFCVSDLCIMQQNGATQAEIEEWKIQLKIMLKIRCRIEGMTTDGAHPPSHYPRKKHCGESGGCGGKSHISQHVMIRTNNGI